MLDRYDEYFEAVRSIDGAAVVEMLATNGTWTDDF
jgi:hypothetical protein